VGTALAASLRDEAVWVIVVCSVILLAGFALYLGVWLCGRRWLKGGEPSGGPTQPWTLEDLRKLREQGDLSEEEYQAMRAATIAAYRGKGSAPEAKAPTADNNDSSDNCPDFDLKKSSQA